MKSFGKRLVATLALALGAAWMAVAQTPRVQFPTPQPSLPPAATAAPPFAANPGYAAPYGAAPYGAPPAGASSGIFGPPPTAPSIAPYGAYPQGPMSAPPYGYGAYPADPRFTQGPSSIFPPSGYNNPYPNGNVYTGTPDGGIAEYTKFIQGVWIEHTWLAGDDGRELDQNDSEVAITTAFPIFPNPKYPLYVSPGFGLHLWDGPAYPDSFPADLPAQAYDAYIDATWRPQFSDGFGMELSIRPGVYTTFDSVNTNSIRIQGRAIGFIRISPTWQLALGATYLDRLDIKLLPTGGLIWTPSEKARYEFLFPKPKLAHYLQTSWTNSEWWIYLTGEYGGGSWTIERVSGADDQIDINDFRVMIGLETRPTQVIEGGGEGAPQRNHSFYFEGGYVFKRQIVYRNEPPEDFDLPDTFLLRAGVRF